MGAERTNKAGASRYTKKRPPPVEVSGVSTACGQRRLLMLGGMPTIGRAPQVVVGAKRTNKAGASRYTKKAPAAGGSERSAYGVRRVTLRGLLVAPVAS